MEIRLFEFCLNYVTYLHFLFRYGKPEFTVMKKPPNSSARLRMRSRLSSTSSSASWRNSWSTAMPWLKRRGWRPRWPTLKMQRWLAGEFQDKLQEHKKISLNSYLDTDICLWMVDWFLLLFMPELIWQKGVWEFNFGNQWVRFWTNRLTSKKVL